MFYMWKREYARIRRLYGVKQSQILDWINLVVLFVLHLRLDTQRLSGKNDVNVDRSLAKSGSIQKQKLLQFSDGRWWIELSSEKNF